MIPTARSRAAHGARMLDYANPGWHQAIDLDTLDLRDGDTCVLAQLYGCYDYGLTRMGLTDRTAQPYGFYLSSCLRSYRVLTRAWKREILARRAEDAQIAAEIDQPGIIHAWLDELADYPAEREPVDAGQR